MRENIDNIDAFTMRRSIGNYGTILAIQNLFTPTFICLFACLFVSWQLVVKTTDLGSYSLMSVARTPRLMSYDIMRTGDTTYSRRVSQIYDRSYAQVARRQHYGSPLVPTRIFYFCLGNFFKFLFTHIMYLVQCSNIN